MKKLLFVGGIFIGAFSILNFTPPSTESSNKSVVNNIKALKASAIVDQKGTFSCDGTNANCCSYPGMNSDGVLRYTTSN